MKTLALCMIVKNEESNLSRCLDSVKSYVHEIIVVDTGSTDNTKKIALDYGCKVFDFNPETNPESFMKDDDSTGAPPPYTNEWMLSDFGAARNFSFSKSSSDYILWLDADDTLEGAEELPDIVKELSEMQQPVAGWFRYDYNFSGDKPNCQLWRERILTRGNGKWLNPIHEVHDTPQGTAIKFFHNISVRHHRDLARPRSVAHRNYKVLKKLYAATKDNLDARTLFYLGNESKFLNLDEAIGYYDQYLRLSGWPEERGVARILLGQIYEMKGDKESAFRLYSSATTDFPSNPDPWFALARLAYYKEDWTACCFLTEKGFALGNPDSPIMFNPLDRTFTPHTFYNVALSRLGRVSEALASCEAGLKIYPDNGNLKFNKDIYIKYLKEHPQEVKEAKESVKKISFAMDSLDDEPNLPHEISTVLALQVWKEMLRHDEVVKARDYLNSLPYFMESDKFVIEAKAKTESLLSFLNTNQKTREYYATHDVNEAIPLEEEIPSYWSQRPRLDAIKTALLGKKNLRILDLGCQDGWISNRLAKLGHSVVGLDFSIGHLEIARRNAERFGLDATFIEGYISDVSDLVREKFDVVLCTEVIEHVEDVESLLTKLNSLIKKNGMVLLSTPKGAWLGGRQLKVNGFTIGNKWNEPREHIRAFSLFGLEKLLSNHFHVRSCYEIPIPRPDVEGQATLFAILEKKQKLKAPENKLKFGVWTGPAYEWWNPLAPSTTGIGGSETAVIEMSKAFVRHGHEVTVYSDCPNMEGIYDGVRYVHFGKLRDTGFDGDVFICSRQPQMMPDHRINSKINVLWVHDIHCGGFDAHMHKSLLKFDFIFCLSAWHKKFFCDTYPLLDNSKVLVTRNGIDLNRFADVNLDKVRPNKLIYTSSANRGLDTLLQLFPKIRERVPDATLDVYYGFDTWRAAAKNDPGMLAQIDALENLAKNTPGVTLKGRVNQIELAKAFKNAKVWAYPTMFTETSCISAMEAQAAGCLVVTTNIAALSETVAHGVLISPPTSDEMYQKYFVQYVVEGLLGLHKNEQRLGTVYAKNLSWDSLATQWEKLFIHHAPTIRKLPHKYVSSLTKS